MSSSKQKNLSIYHSGLNEKLVESHYPHLANKLFENLALPPGLIVKTKPTSQNISICNSIDSCIECMSDKQWAQLTQPTEIKSEKKRTRRKKADTNKKSKKHRKK